MRNRQRGFTLIEITIALAVILILGSIAVPAYTSYLTRSRLSEGLLSALPVKVEMAEPFESTAAMTNAAAAANARNRSSKYVRTVQVTAATGMITITFDEAKVPGLTAATNTLTLTPYVNNGGVPLQLGTAAATGGSSGVLVWGCASAAATTANSHGTTPAVMGTVPSKYAPAECR